MPFPTPCEDQVTEGEEGRGGKAGSVGKAKGDPSCLTSELSSNVSHKKYKMFNNLKLALLILIVFISGIIIVNWFF